MMLLLCSAKIKITFSHLADAFIQTRTISNQTQQESKDMQVL